MRDKPPPRIVYLFYFPPTENEKGIENKSIFLRKLI